MGLYHAASTAFMLLVQPSEGMQLKWLNASHPSIFSGYSAYGKIRNVMERSFTLEGDATVTGEEIIVTSDDGLMYDDIVLAVTAPSPPTYPSAPTIKAPEAPQLGSSYGSNSYTDNSAYSGNGYIAGNGGYSGGYGSYSPELPKVRSSGYTLAYSQDNRGNGQAYSNGQKPLNSSYSEDHYDLGPDYGEGPVDYGYGSLADPESYGAYDPTPYQPASYGRDLVAERFPDAAVLPSSRNTYVYEPQSYGYHPKGPSNYAGAYNYAARVEKATQNSQSGYGNSQSGYGQKKGYGQSYRKPSYKSPSTYRRYSPSR